MIDKAGVCESRSGGWPAGGDSAPRNLLRKREAPIGVSLGRQETKTHAATHDQRVHPVQQRPDHPEFVAHLRPAEHRHKGRRAPCRRSPRIWTSRTTTRPAADGNRWADPRPTRGSGGRPETLVDEEVLARHQLVGRTPDRPPSLGGEAQVLSSRPGRVGPDGDE